jgi:hypothetical protein
MLQVVTYNLGGARKLRTPPHNPEQVGKDAAAFLKKHITPDVPTLLGLQEVGQLGRVGGRVTASYAALCGGMGADYRAHFAAEVDLRTHPHAGLWSRPPYADGPPITEGAEGNGIVSNLPQARPPWPVWDGWSVDYAAPVVAGISAASLYSTGSRDTQPRNLMVGFYAHPNYGALTFMNTHLGTVRGEDRHNPDHERTREGTARRVQQANQIVRVLGELRAAEVANEEPARPVILVGDFNAVLGAVPMQALTDAGFALLAVEDPVGEAWTHIGHRILIDHVLVSDPRGVLPAGRARILTDAPADLSDHLPVVAVFG